GSGPRPAPVRSVIAVTGMPFRATRSSKALMKLAFFGIVVSFPSKLRWNYAVNVYRGVVSINQYHVRTVFSNGVYRGSSSRDQRALARSGGVERGGTRLAAPVTTRS